MELHEFLEARIAEDEAVAKEAQYQEPTPWTHDDCEVFSSKVKMGPYGRQGPQSLFDAEGGYVNGTCCFAAGEHIARFDPARILAECAAKRAVVERYSWAVERANEADAWDQECIPVETALEGVLEALAAPYRDHPEFNPEWLVA